MDGASPIAEDSRYSMLPELPHNKPLPEGVKFDEGKLKLMILDTLGDPDFLAEIAAVLEFGAKKYEPRNWEKGMAWSRPYNATRRHLLAFARGESNDPETGRHHLAHATCCLMFLFHYDRKGMPGDDRIIP
jgi:hypothetical protein